MFKLAASFSWEQLMNEFTSIKYQNGGKLSLLDQRLLPLEEKWIDIQGVSDGVEAISQMVVRGAPAIATAACFSLSVELYKSEGFDGVQAEVEQWIAYLAGSRPTAVNLGNQLLRLKDELSQQNFRDISSLRWFVEQFARKIEAEDQATCKQIGEQGADWFEEKMTDDNGLTLLTHCNTGALATSGIGTAIGILVTLHRRGKLKKVYVDETRPWLQGARLTAYELQAQGIPCELVVDSCAAWLMAQGCVDGVVVGADRIARNGDTANKVGTYGLSISAKYHGVPFVVAAPMSTFDENLETGKTIEIEQRPSSEITEIKGSRVAPKEIEVYNPSFDITPGNLITAIITENGIHKKS